jgi:putative endonuclease
MARSHRLGAAGERLVAAYFRSRGYTVLGTNVREGHAELDLVVRRGRTVAFVEVKTRAGSRYGHPLEAITRAKRREVERVAAAWVRRHGRAGDVYRFDAVAVSWGRGTRPTIEHVADAWRR